jgi:cytochrome o ubiquinol oxidase subunit II
VSATRNDGPVLNLQTYSDLAKPSEAVAPFTYRKVAPNLFNGIILDSGMQSGDPLCSTDPASQRAER